MFYFNVNFRADYTLVGWRQRGGRGVAIVTGVRLHEHHTATVDDADTATMTWTMITVRTGRRMKTTKHSVLPRRSERSVRTVFLHGIVIISCLHVLLQFVCLQHRPTYLANELMINFCIKIANLNNPTGNVCSHPILFLLNMWNIKKQFIVFCKNVDNQLKKITCHATRPGLWVQAKASDYNAN